MGSESSASFKGYPYTNPGWVKNPITPGKLSRGAGQMLVRVIICWKFNTKGHISTSYTIHLETNNQQIIANYEALNIFEKGQVPLCANIRLNKILIEDSSNKLANLKLSEPPSGAEK